MAELGFVRRCSRLMKSAMAIFSVCAFTACSNIGNTLEEFDHYERPDYERQQYRTGVKAAKADLHRGILAYEDLQCEEEEGWRILWCYRKLLSDRGVQYRVHSSSPVPGVSGRCLGYNSITSPLIAATLGVGWESRIYKEARTFYSNHWREVAHLYESDRKNDIW